MNEKELYEKHYGENKLRSENLLPRWRKMLNSFDLHREELALSLLEGGEKFLDVGCGNGSLAFKASKKFQEVYGVDICETSIKEAKQSVDHLFTGESKFYFHACNINEKIDFPDGTFDAVASIAVIEHVFDPYFVVREVHRVLKPGGIFVAQVPNIAYFKQRICLLMGKLPVTAYPYNVWSELGWDGGHLHYFTKKTFCGLFEDCGFQILEVSGCGFLAKFRNFYSSLLTGDICVKAKKC
jgi:2-polyprenyl-3-methyl-5-hydroxy-6-metoxy-1,4-benzoquinol methylase